jgi:hypothetical protein
MIIAESLYELGTFYLKFLKNKSTVPGKRKSNKKH